MEIEKLFKGIAVIIDNEIKKENSAIFKIKELIENKNIPVAFFTEIPGLEIIPSLASASFIILDWDYTNGKLEVENDERIAIPSGLAEYEEERIIEFIRMLLYKVFVPIFIFTQKPKDNVIDSLKNANLWSDDRPNRIFVKQKMEVDSEDELFSAISEWVKQMPSVYVLKQWEQVLRETQNAMFNEFYAYSPNWAKIIWAMLKEDSIESQQEFGDFVTRSMINRIQGYSFDETLIQSQNNIVQDELRKVVEGERYFAYKTQPSQAYTGDLFKDGSKYFLNIRAQCATARKDNQGKYSPLLYCIKGKKLRNQDIISEDIRLTTEQELVFGALKHFTLDQMREISNNPERLDEFNRNFTKHRNSIFFRKGTFLERDDKVVIGCVAGQQALQFEMDINVLNFDEIKDKRIGRILPPYITKIQQKCAVHMVQAGISPLPKELFLSFDE